MGNAVKLIAALMVLGGALLGFWLFPDIYKVVAWLIFLVVSYPVLVALLGTILHGETFSEKTILSMYRASLRSLPIIGRLIPPARNG